MKGAGTEAARGAIAATIYPQVFVKYIQNSHKGTLQMFVQDFH